MEKRTKGITMVALVVTILVMLILAGITIYLTLGENGLLNRTQGSVTEHTKQEATEEINFKITTAQMNKYIKEQRMPTLKELAETLKEDNEISYVTQTSQIASVKYEVGENPSSIYTKLNKYPYEFEINRKLQLASIDGVKIANNNQGTVTLTQTQYDDILNRLTALENNTSSTSESINYSTEEQVVGTWIDGKPLYRKVIIGNMKSSANVIADISDLNIEFVYSINGILEYIPNGKYVNAIGYASSSDWGFVYITEDCKFLSSMCGSNYKDKKGWFTLEYTKKTEE